MLKCRHSEALPELITAFVRVISKNQLIRLLKIKSKNKCVRKKKNKFSFKNIDLVLHTTGTCSYNCHFFAALFRRQRRQAAAANFEQFTSKFEYFTFLPPKAAKKFGKKVTQILCSCAVCVQYYLDHVSKNMLQIQKNLSFFSQQQNWTSAINKIRLLDNITHI